MLLDQFIAILILVLLFLSIYPKIDDKYILIIFMTGIIIRDLTDNTLLSLSLLSLFNDWKLFKL